MALTDTAVRTAKPKDKPYKLADDRGLFLLVNPSGGKLWRLKYRIDGKEKLLAIGPYPEVSLATARERREEARKLLTNGIDPSAHKQAAKAATAKERANTLEAVAREWYQVNESSWVSDGDFSTPRPDEPSDRELGIEIETDELWISAAEIERLKRGEPTKPATSPPTEALRQLKSEPSTKGRNSYLRTIHALAQVIAGDTTQPHKAAGIIIKALADKEITEPVTERKLGDYLSEARNQM